MKFAHYESRIRIGEYRIGEPWSIGGEEGAKHSERSELWRKRRLSPPMPPTDPPELRSSCELRAFPYAFQLASALPAADSTGLERWVSWVANSLLETGLSAESKPKLWYETERSEGGVEFNELI